ncbi:hypothetical protein [Massilia yuzhufengensis]|uniref:Uncharacterized protein n=1 Tax=Massilia yuzhufengensis TaxID=1164594 RepID=A0A1I1MP45_9BURK|nr:hypothetical protein [Massilia yuzhufengensis]SFC84968.1 hypothetical protein SAMN05216204_11140 [Massilia yuzhufengensis]
MHAVRFLPAVLFAAGGLVSAATADQAATVRHQLEVETTGNKVRVRLMVENRGDATIWVPRELAAGEDITGRRFEVLDASGKPVDYTGMMVKRGAFTAADFHPVAPHTTHMNTLDITPSYAFRKGKHGYQIRYDGPWLADVKQLDAVSHSPAAPVRFSFTGP